MLHIPVSAPLAFFSAMRAPAQARSAGGDKHAPHAPRLPITQVSNATPSPDAGAHSGSGTRSAASPPSGGQADFQHLAEARGWSLAEQSTEGLKALRQQVLTAARPDGKAPAMTPGEQTCLLAGLNLELLQRPGIWNESSGDLQSVIVNTPGWPAGRALRIVDADNDAIHLYRPGMSEQCHRGNDPELPSPQDDEIILLRHGNHFSLIRRDQDQVIEDVRADGDCFFSCISKALQAEDLAASNLQLRRQLAEHVWNTPELLQVAGAYEGPAPAITRTPLRHQPVASLQPPPQESAPATVAPAGARPALTPGILKAFTDMYHSEMTRYLSEGHYAPDGLDAIHQELRDLLLLQARELMADPQPGHLDPLGRDMDLAYASYKRDNTAKLKTLQGIISKEQKRAMFSYMAQIETVLAQPTPLEALEREHRRIQQEAQEGLRKAIHDRVDEGEPIRAHQEVLDAEIDEYWRNTVAPRANDALDVPGSAAPGGL
ncbi:hypothetical protein ABE522_13880 [Stenotrophomonas pennii]|uniref:hypothetical protein n=1 Tax=Stenotrophomonas lacuserhaii TaxID=2760084 RepID=UPI00320B1101